jgi:hypothetical protein
MGRIGQSADDTLSEHGEALPGISIDGALLQITCLRAEFRRKRSEEKLTGIQKATGAVLAEKCTSCEQARIFWLVVEPI